MNDELKSEKILKDYCLKNFALVSIPYDESITILSNKGILFHYRKDSLFQIDNYEFKVINPLISHIGLKNIILLYKNRNITIHIYL